jgi:hypothetical protein
VLVNGDSRGDPEQRIILFVAGKVGIEPSRIDVDATLQDFGMDGDDAVEALS